MKANSATRRLGDALRGQWPAAAILCAFLVLGALYSVVDPIFEASDELNHYPFVQTLAQGHGLPVQRPGVTTLWGQEGSQPPLYYALAAGLTFWIDSNDLPDVLYLNPHAERGVPLARDNKNMIVHTEREAFPWHGTVLAVHLIRFFSVLLGAGTVLCTYLLARTLFPGQPALAYGAMALNAFIPMFLFISASVNNDNLVICLASLSLLLVVRLVQGEPRPRSLVLLGVVIGLASLSKLSALGLLPLTALGLALRQWQGAAGRRRGASRGRAAWMPGLRRLVRDCALVFVPVALVAGWWYVRNWQLYGDPTGLSAMLAIAGRRHVAATVFTLLDEFQGFRINFWGLFGGVNVLMKPAGVYEALDGLSLLAVAGLLAWLWQARRRRTSQPWLPLFLVVAWIGVELVSLIRWTVATAASQGRLLFPALSALCLLFALGWAGWLAGRYQRIVVGALTVLFFLLAASAPFTAIRPAYAAAPIVTAAGVPPTAHPVNVDYGGTARLLAYETDRAAFRPGEGLHVTLYWQALAPTKEDFSVYLQLFSWRQDLGQVDSYPGGGSRPTSLWMPGQVIEDTYWVPASETATGPTPAWIALGLYRLSTKEKLPATDPAGKPVVYPTIGKFMVQVPAPTLLPAHRLDANLAGRVRVIGYDLASETVRPGSELPITLYWQVTAKLDKDYTAFIHLLDEKGEAAVKVDGKPLEGFYPTSQWSGGEILNDEHSVAIPKDIRPGTYQVIAGLYDPATGERLPVLDVAGNPSDTEVRVARVVVGE